MNPMRYKSAKHRDRFAEAIRKKDKKDSRLMAALYLLTSDIRVWNFSKQYVSKTGIDFENIRLPNITDTKSSPGYVRTSLDGEI